MRKKISNKVLFFHEYRLLGFPLKKLKKTADEIYRNERKIGNKIVNVILCSDYKIRKLNGQYRNIDHTTDVLSFPFDDDDLLGEVYISLQRAAIQARRYKVPYADEVNRLFIHGLAHLLGFDHATEKDRKKMELYEKRYLLNYPLR